jgi:glutathione S-transferase
MLQIYHVTGTRGMRVIWLCEELGIDYEVTKIDFSAEFRGSDEWRALSPVGKVPIMVDGDMVMFESGAMVQYVLAKYADGKLVPSLNSPQYGHYLQWLWFAEATFSRPLGEMVNHGRAFPGDARIDAVVAEMAGRAEACAQAVADAVQDRDYLLGNEFTAADIMMGYTIMLVETFTPELFPEALQPYWQRLQARTAFQTARAL